MTIEQELRDVWAKYETQRSAEREILKTRREANEELTALNTRRVAAGLPMVSEFQSGQGHGIQAGYVYAAPQKAWRDDMEGELLAVIRRHFE